MPARTWKTLSRSTLLDLGRFCKVESHTVELPDGRVIDGWTWLVTPDYVIVVTATEDGRFIFFRQTKYAVEGLTLATPGGYMEPGEEPLAAAQRELLEETGYEAPEWISLGRFPVDGNRGNGIANLFLARRARRVAQRDADDLEEQEMLLLTQAEMQAALTGGEFKLLPWATVVALALLYLQSEGATG